MKTPPYFVCCCFLYLYSVSACCILAHDDQNHDRFLQCLQHQNDQISQVIYTPNNTSYIPILVSSVQNPRYRTPFQPMPAVIVTPLNYIQVQTVVSCSRNHGFQVRARCGGHDYEGLSTKSYYPNPYVILDLRNLNSVSIDTKTRSAWVQGGALLGEVYHKIAEKSPNLAFPAGLCPTVGVGGHFSGGGEGTLSRKYGMASDNIIDAKIVDANGVILDRKSMGEDLFWAIRGGGGASFGVILEFKIRLVYVPSIVTVFTINKTLDQNATKLVHIWQTIAPELDRNLFIRLVISQTTDQNRKTTVNVAFNSLFLGSTDDLMLIIQEEFPELGLGREYCKEMKWIEAALYFSDLPSGSTVDDLVRRTPYPNKYYKAKSDYVVDPIPESGLEGIWTRFKDEYAERSQIIFAPYGGRMAQISESSIPFPHRAGNLYQIQHLVYWVEKQNANSERYIDWIKELYTYMTPFVTKSPRLAYYNYLDLDLGFNKQANTTFSEAAKWGFRYFKNNFHRLAQVKTASDPSNFFRFELSIPVAESR